GRGVAAGVKRGPGRAAALGGAVEPLAPGGGAGGRPPSEKELRATSVLAFPIEEGSAKTRNGPPVDDEEDYSLPAWAGVLPLLTHAGPPEADPRLSAGIPQPPYVSDYRRPGS